MSRHPLPMRAYQLLLKLYPTDYQHRCAGQMLNTAEDMLTDAHSPRERGATYVTLFSDLSTSIFRTQLKFIGDQLLMDTPKYVKITAVISSVLLVPFIAALLANGIDRLIYHQTLYTTWVWSKPALTIWILRLPEIALIGSLLCLLVAVIKSRPKTASVLRKFLAAWPLFIPGLIALGIMFIIRYHDSGRCFTHNPMLALSHPTQTIGCITHNQSGSWRLFF